MNRRDRLMSPPHEILEDEVLPPRELRHLLGHDTPTEKLGFQQRGWWDERHG